MKLDIIKKVQKCEMDILLQIDSICKKYNLEYFAIGGSCLGAVRHSGFIPWDDDIDIAMKRTDYEKFIEIAKTELSSEYHLQNFFTEPATPFYFTKIRKNNTKFVEFYLKDCNIHHGIFVDIFPFDNIPDGKIIRKLHFKLCRFFYQLYLSKTLNTVCSSQFENPGEYTKNYKHYIRQVLHTLLIPVSKNLLFTLLDKSVRLFNDKKTENMGHIVRKRLTVSRDMLYPIKNIPFENIFIPVPGDYDTYLKNQYGDYMNIPPAEQQFSHLPYQVET